MRTMISHKSANVMTKFTTSSFPVSNKVNIRCTGGILSLSNVIFSMRGVNGCDVFIYLSRTL
jgi:hypothetical protein